MTTMFETIFSPPPSALPTMETKEESKTKLPRNTIYPMHHSAPVVSGDVTLNTIDEMLENEKRHNKSETWNKLDKTVKLQKLHAFAETYGRDHGLPVKTIASLKTFFVNCLEKNKLQKTKEVVYDKEKREITAIPSLFLNSVVNAFTLK